MAPFKAVGEHGSQFTSWGDGFLAVFTSSQ
jgi:hypothetical protein